MATRRAFLRRVAQLSGVLAAPALLSACAPAAPTARPAEPTAAAKPAAPTAPAAPAAAPAQAAPAGRFVFTWGSSDFPVRMNPQYTTNVPTTMFYDNFYDTLTRRDPDMKLLPGLATEWKLANDTTWQIKLRPNVKWHNGDPFTAADVKFTIERTYDPAAKTIHATVFQTVKQIDIVDDLTLNFLMKAPDALLPARFAHYGGYLMPMKYFQQVGDAEFEKQPIGTGPFKFVEYVKDDHLTLEANKEYWGGPPNVDGLLIRPLPEAAARIAALQKGDVHFIDRVPDDQMDSLEKAPTSQTFSVPFNGVSFICVNTKSPPLDKKEVRQALNLSLDRQSIAQDLFLGRSALATGPIMWKDVGLNAKLQIIEGSVRSQKIADHSFTGLFTAAFVSTLQDPSGLMWRSAGPGGVLSWYFTNDEWERLGKEAETSLDQEKRRANYERMADIMMDEVAWIVLFQPAQNFAAQKFIQWRPHGNYMADFRSGNLSLKR